MYGLAFSPDGTRLAIGSGDNTIRLWDVASRQEVCQLRGHDSYVHAVAFSPDGTRLASASGDMTVRIWDTLPPSVRAQPPDGSLSARGQVSGRGRARSLATADRLGPSVRRGEARRRAGRIGPR